MANKIFRLRMLVMVLVFGMSVVGYVHGQSNNGTFTLTDIPAKYNGKYAMFVIMEEGIFGLQSLTIENFTLVRIANGRVVLPMWVVTGTMSASFRRYSGNTVADISVKIFDQSRITLFELEDELAEIDFENVAFSNGSAIKSFKDGELYEW